MTNTKTNSRRNGPVVTYKFKDEEHRDLYDRKKITLSEATEVVPPTPFLFMVTQSKVKKLREYLRNYCYPKAIKEGATRFLIVRESTGEVVIHKYLYMYQLVEFILDRDLTIYVTNQL